MAAAAVVAPAGEFPRRQLAVMNGRLPGITRRAEAVGSSRQCRELNFEDGVGIDAHGREVTGDLEAHEAVQAAQAEERLQGIDGSMSRPCSCAQADNWDASARPSGTWVLSWLASRRFRARGSSRVAAQATSGALALRRTARSCPSRHRLLHLADTQLLRHADHRGHLPAHHRGDRQHRRTRYRDRQQPGRDAPAPGAAADCPHPAPAPPTMSAPWASPSSRPSSPSSRPSRRSPTSPTWCQTRWTTTG
jgi:hypothetical protein